MLNQALVIARKEVVDGMRDCRSVVSSALYALMGPAVIGMVSVATRGSGKPDSNAGVVIGMMSIFALVAAFVGGMNVAMDIVAGERERRSLLPLLLNPVRRLDILLGKWLAVSLFAVAGFLIDVVGFAVVFAISGTSRIDDWPRALLVLAFGILPLPLLAASAQLLISTICRAVKEAQTYLSMIVFLPMGIGMFFVFFPAARGEWSGFFPLVGQQQEIEKVMGGAAVSLVQPFVLGCLTVAAAILLLVIAARRLQSDEIIYGN